MKENYIDAQMYMEEDWNAVEKHIETYFGTYPTVLHERQSPDIHVDICIIPPSEQGNYYTLVTMGMGARVMNVPEELAEYKLERAELLITLPADWKLDEASMQDENWYWPIRLLKSTARLPLEQDTWLGWGHTVSLYEGETYAENTQLSSVMLVDPEAFGEDAFACRLSDGSQVNFYQLLPLYTEEAAFKVLHSAEELLDWMDGVSLTVDVNRPNVMENWEPEPSPEAGMVMDDAAWHLESIREKNLSVDDLTACNHLAIYLRWAIENDLMSEAFVERHGDIVHSIKGRPSGADLRAFLRDELHGVLALQHFNEEGQDFAWYYYGSGEAPYFPSDIDDYALQYFGPARYHSNEFQDEAYLFIPFDEDYYRNMAAVIEKRFRNWKGLEIAEEQTEPSPLADALMDYLNCRCTYFPPMSDDDPIVSAYSYAQRLGVREGYVPVLVAADDETLWECLLMNSGEPGEYAGEYAFDGGVAARYREKMLALPLQDGKAVLAEMTGLRREEASEDEREWEEEILGEMEGGEVNDRFSGIWDFGTRKTLPLILAEIPVEHPWEVFAYLPFGGWNECPDTPELMAAAKYWYEKYGAVPAVMTHDVLEFDLPAPISCEQAMELALQQYGFCPDIVDQGVETVGALADMLRKSKKWYFWWD